MKNLLHFETEIFGFSHNTIVIKTIGYFFKAMADMIKPTKCMITLKTTSLRHLSPAIIQMDIRNTPKATHKHLNMIIVKDIPKITSKFSYYTGFLIHFNLM